MRDRVLYNLIAFALLLSGAAILVGEISIDVERLVVVNLGLTAVSLFGVVIAIFIGIGLVSKEIDKRTLYTVLSRPVRRWEFVVGKFFGLTGTLVVNTFLMAVGVFLALLYVAHKFEKMDAWVLVALYFIVLQFLIVCALALFFSSFSTPLMSAVFTFALFVIGSLAEDLRGFARITHGGGRLARHRRSLSGAEFFRFERDQPGGARRSCIWAADSLQQRLRVAVLGDGHLGSGVDLPAPGSEMTATRRANLVAIVGAFLFHGGRNSDPPCHRPHPSGNGGAGSALRALFHGTAAHEPRLHRPAGRHLLDASGAVFRGTASQWFQRFPLAGAVARSHDGTGSEAVAGVSVRGQLSGSKTA